MGAVVLLPPLVVLDFEGTSRSASARATEIGIVTLGNSLQIKSEFETLVNSPVTPESMALQVSRLSAREISKAPNFAALWPYVRDLFNGKVIVAHNKIYEINVLQNELAEISISNLPPFLCTLEWSRRILGSKVSNHQLATLCNFFDIELVHAHEAISDARATALLLGKLAALSPALKTEIRELEGQTVTYKGTASAKVQPLVRERFQTENGNSANIETAKARIKKQGMSLVVVTGTPDIGKEEFGSLVKKVGLQYRETPPTKSTAFVVQSNNGPGMSKIRRALELNVPVLSESDALLLVKTLGSNR